MPFCPNCGSEYDMGVKVCCDCHCELVDKITPEKQLQPIQEAFLLTVSDDMEYKIVESKLGEYGIPITKRYKGSGAVTQIYMGRTFGLDVYVPETVLRKAKEILEDRIDTVNKTAESQRPQETSDFTKRRTWAKKVLLICVIMTLVVLGFLAVTYLVLFLNLL